jgi:cysteine synthase A
MIEDALASGALCPGMTIVEPTSGNTGIGLAFAAAAHGFRTVFAMPDTMTVERRHLLRSLGAVVVLTEGAKGMKGAIERANQLLERLGPAGWMPRQFDNPANPKIHYETTGPEIWQDSGGEVDVFVAGVGTGGTLTGAGRYLRERKETLRIVAVEPAESPVLSGGSPGPHRQQGIGPGFVPGVLDTSLIDEVVQVRNEEAIEMSRRLAREEGILAGISAGSATVAALAIAARPESAGQLVVAIIPDSGDRYLSNPVYAEVAAPEVPEEIRDLVG